MLRTDAPAPCPELHKLQMRRAPRGSSAMNPKISDSVGEGEKVWRPRPCAELEVERAGKRQAMGSALGTKHPSRTEFRRLSVHLEVREVARHVNFNCITVFGREVDELEGHAIISLLANNSRM